MEIKDILIRILKKIIYFFYKKKFYAPECIYDRQISNDYIYELLDTDKPIMISRFGTVELNTINNYLTIKSKKSYLKKIYIYLTEKTHTPWWNKAHFSNMYINAGIFPPELEIAEKFSIRYLQDIPLIDLLGSHQYYEKFMPLKEDIIKVQLETLYPFFVERPWTRILKNKKVLVIHPFEDSIKEQYNKRHLIFENEYILPDFELITYRAIQSIAGNIVPYKDWFEALEKMENDISKIDFDYALIGCGAYGLPLSAYIKNIGKKAIHLGGGLQLIFGILGKRWTEQYEDYWYYRPDVKIDTNYRKLFNKHWIYPLPSDTPKDSNLVENSCYWK